MNLSDSKKKLALAGAVCGIVAAILALLGNPANMAFCIACFIRDTAGAFGMHQAEVVQYARPEIIGLVLGAFLISVATKEYRSTAGSSPMIRFVLGVIIIDVYKRQARMWCALAAISCLEARRQESLSVRRNTLIR